MSLEDATGPAISSEIAAELSAENGEENSVQVVFSQLSVIQNAQSGRWMVAVAVVPLIGHTHSPSWSRDTADVTFSSRAAERSRRGAWSQQFEHRSTGSRVERFRASRVLIPLGPAPGHRVRLAMQPQEFSGEGFWLANRLSEERSPTP